MARTTFPRYLVALSAGRKDGKRYGIWDGHERKIIEFYRTRPQALKVVRALNGKDKGQ